MKKMKFVLIAVSLTASLVILMPDDNLGDPESVVTTDKETVLVAREYSQRAQMNTAEQEPENHEAHYHDSTVLPEQEVAAMDTAWWFEPPRLSSRHLFEQEATPIELDSSCLSTNTLPFNANRSIEENFKALNHADPQERFPEDLFYFSLTQFFQVGQDYYQFVALWERTMPARYRYEFYRSHDPSFNSAVTPVDLPVAIPALKDVLATNHYVQQLLEHYQQQGAQVGARILEASINDPQGDQQVILVNAKVTQWSTYQFSCDSGTDFNKSYCHCDTGANS